MARTSDLQSGDWVRIPMYPHSRVQYCILILQSLNASKNDKSSITIEQLIEDIKKWDKKYKTTNNV